MIVEFVWLLFLLAPVVVEVESLRSRNRKLPEDTPPDRDADLYFPYTTEQEFDYLQKEYIQCNLNKMDDFLLHIYSISCSARLPIFRAERAISKCCEDDTCDINDISYYACPDAICMNECIDSRRRGANSVMKDYNLTDPRAQFVVDNLPSFVDMLCEAKYCNRGKVFRGYYHQIVVRVHHETDLIRNIGTFFEDIWTLIKHRPLPYFILFNKLETSDLEPIIYSSISSKNCYIDVFDAFLFSEYALNCKNVLTLMTEVKPHIVACCQGSRAGEQCSKEKIQEMLLYTGEPGCQQNQDRSLREFNDPSPPKSLVAYSEVICQGCFCKGPLKDIWDSPENIINPKYYYHLTSLGVPNVYRLYSTIRLSMKIKPHNYEQIRHMVSDEARKPRECTRDN